MNRNLGIVWFVAIFFVMAIVGNQMWQLCHLFRQTNAEYVLVYRNIVKDALSELSLMVPKEGYTVGYDAERNLVAYYMDGKRIIREVAADVSTQWIKGGPMYDIRDTSQWTLAVLNEAIQKRLMNWNGKEHLPIKMVVRDSLGNKVKHFRQGEVRGRFPCRFTEKLGFLSKDTLDVTCDFTFGDFWAKARGQMILVAVLLFLLILCAITLVQMLWREKRASAFRELFVQAFVHDLKLPVSNALKCEYLLEKSLASGETSGNERWLAQIDDQLMRVQGTIGMLLTALTDEHGVAVRPGEVDIHQVLEELAGSGRWHVTAGRTFRITTDLQVKNPLIEGDEVLLEAVFQNLIENALKYSEGHVDITISSREADGRGVQIVVADNGLGIPGKSLRKIFKPRYRIPEYKDRVKGTGIGLSVTKSIIEAHGGTVRAESEKGRGSRFIITLPYQIAKGWKTKLTCYTRRMMRMRRD